MKKLDMDRELLNSGEQKSDGKRFGFLNGISDGLDIMLKKVNTIMRLIDNSKPYQIDYRHVDQEYLAHGVGDIDEFCSGYTFGCSMIYGFVNDKAAKQAHYEEVREYLWKKKRKGLIS